MEQDERFEAVSAAHFDAVLRFAVARVEPEAAKDIAAETFAAAWRGMDRLPAQPRGWLLAIARRRIADHYRAAGRRVDLAADIAESSAGSSPDHSGPVVERDHIRAAFARLRPADREVLQMLAWDGLSRSEAARVLGCSAPQFAVRLHRARRRLREALDHREPAAALQRGSAPVAHVLMAEETS